MARVTGYQPWVAHNHAVITNSIDLFVAEVRKEIVKSLRMVADDMLRYIEDEADVSIPIYTGNMHDATGVAIYVDGKTNYLKVPKKKATRKQRTGPSMGNRRQIDGHDFLMKSITEGAGVFNNGIWIVLYSAVPYAAHIDTLGSPLDRGKEYFWRAREKFANMVLKSLTPLNKVGVFNI